MWNVTSVVSACIRGAPQMVFASLVLRSAGRLTPPPKKRQFKREWLLTRSWLRYDATRDKMWCLACQQHPQLGHSFPFVQGTTNFMLCSLKYHQRVGSHAVSLALWQSGGRVTSVIQTLPSHVLQGILALFKTVYSMAHRSCPLSHLEGDAELVSLNGGTILPSYRSPPSGRDVLRFISHPFRFSKGLVINESSFFSIASDSCTDRAFKREELCYVHAVVDGAMATNFFVSSFSTVWMGLVWFKANVVGLSASSATYRRRSQGMMWWCHITHPVTDVSWPLRPPSAPRFFTLIAGVLLRQMPCAV